MMRDVLVEEIKLKKRLKEIRLRKKFTQDVVAKKMFVSRTTVVSIENYDKPLKLDYMIRYANILGYKIVVAKKKKGAEE